MTGTRRYFPKVHDWVGVGDKKPYEFDLVKMKYSDGEVALGWWNGGSWIAAKRSRPFEVVEWKRHDARYGDNEG